jgi:hypothetical protein
VNKEEKGKTKPVVAPNPQAGPGFTRPVSEDPTPEPTQAADADEDQQQGLDGAFGKVGDAGKQADEGVDAMEALEHLRWLEVILRRRAAVWSLIWFRMRQRVPYW